MKSYFYKYLLLTICFLLFLNEQSVVAQTNTLYPIDLSVNIAPPYTTNLSEYSSTSGKFQLSLRRKDLYHKTWNLYVRLTLSDFAGNKCVMYSDQLSTDPKLNLIKDFQQFIKHQTCNSLIKDNGFLLEGGYTLTFEAVDRSLDKDIPLSQPVTQTIYFEQGKAPILIFPQNEEEIQCGANIINFSWQLPKIIAEQFVYRLEVVNVTNYTGAYEYAFNNPERALSVTCHTPNYTWTQFVNQILNDQQTYKFVWRVSIEDPSGNLKSTYANQGISPVYSFIYCPNKSLLWNETEDESDIVMKSKNYDDEMDVLPLQSVQKNGADIYAFWNLEPEIASKYSGVSIEYQTLGKDKWASESIIYSENSNDINTLALKLDKGLTYNVRGQYFKENEDHERIYGPYSDILQYAESNEDEEKEDCGSSLPEVKDCSEGSTLSLNVGDYISCHGTPVEITKISSGPTKNGSNWTVSGEGTLAFKFLEELKLKVKFDNIIVNCEKEFVKGEVLTIYDEKKGFVVNLNELFGKTNDGSNGSTVENVTLKNNLENPGDLKRDGNKIQMLTDDGQVVTIGEVVNVNDLNYDVKQEKMSNDVECIVYFTGANTPFDNDLHNLKNILVNYYHPFDERRTYYMPYVAITNGNISEVTTSKNGDCQYVKYIMKLSDEEVIVLNEDGGKVKVPGSNTTNSSQVFAICKNQEGNYVNCGSMLISNYAMTQQELHIIPLTSDQKDKINEKDLKDYLDKIYKGLGYDYKIVIEDVLADEDEWIEKNVLKDGLKIAADDQSIWKSSTDEMKQLCTIYAQKNPAAINTQNSSYLFLVPEAEEDAYKTTSGDMPRGQSVGYIFTNVVKESEDIYHTIAHELGHGFKLEHLFDQSTKIAQGSTTNLMDYSAGNHNDLIHFQWNNMHNEHILIWPLLESDEDGMKGGKKGSIAASIASCLGEAIGNSIISEGADLLKDIQIVYDPERGIFLTLPKDLEALKMLGSLLIKTKDNLKGSECLKNIVGKEDLDQLNFIFGLYYDAAECYMNSESENDLNQCLCDVFFGLGDEFLKEIKNVIWNQVKESEEYKKIIEKFENFTLTKKYKEIKEKVEKSKIKQTYDKYKEQYDKFKEEHPFIGVFLEMAEESAQENLKNAGNAIEEITGLDEVKDEYNEIEQQIKDKVAEYKEKFKSSVCGPKQIPDPYTPRKNDPDKFDVIYDSRESTVSVNIITNVKNPLIRADMYYYNSDGTYCKSVDLIETIFWCESDHINSSNSTYWDDPYFSCFTANSNGRQWKQSRFVNVWDNSNESKQEWSKGRCLTDRIYSETRKAEILEDDYLNSIKKQTECATSTLEPDKLFLKRIQIFYYKTQSFGSTAFVDDDSELEGYDADDRLDYLYLLKFDCNQDCRSIKVVFTANLRDSDGKPKTETRSVYKICRDNIEEQKEEEPVKMTIIHDDCYELDSKGYLTDPFGNQTDARKSNEINADVPKCSGWKIKDGQCTISPINSCGSRVENLFTCDYEYDETNKKITSVTNVKLNQEVAKAHALEVFEYWDNTKKIIVMKNGGTYELIDLYGENGFIGLTADQLANLDGITSEQFVNSIFFKMLKSFVAFMIDWQYGLWNTDDRFNDKRANPAYDEKEPSSAKCVDRGINNLQYVYNGTNSFREYLFRDYISDEAELMCMRMQREGDINIIKNKDVCLLAYRLFDPQLLNMNEYDILAGVRDLGGIFNRNINGNTEFLKVMKSLAQMMDECCFFDNYICVVANVLNNQVPESNKENYLSYIEWLCALKVKSLNGQQNTNIFSTSINHTRGNDNSNETQFIIEEDCKSSISTFMDYLLNYCNSYNCSK